MKPLQNDFTTPEQSKRLLELGVPADSANMLWDGYIDSTQRWTLDPYPRYLEYPYSVEIESGSDLYISHVLPCWSVGRLMEIYDTCVENTESWPTVKQGISYVINIIVAIDYTVREGIIDFSKLEE